MKIVLLIFGGLALSGILAGILGNKSKSGKKKQASSTPADKAGSGGGMLNTLKAKAEGVKQHFTLKNALAVLGAIVVVSAIFGFASTANQPKVAVDTANHTLIGVCRGEVYSMIAGEKVLFKPMPDTRQNITLREGHTFEEIDVRVLYLMPGGTLREYRYDGVNLVDTRNGKKTRYSIEWPPQGMEGFYIKIGENNKTREVPPGTIKVEYIPDEVES
jgi:hypothetical protein